MRLLVIGLLALPLLAWANAAEYDLGTSCVAVERVAAVEQWRVESDDNILIGKIYDVCRGSQGNVYCLDHQLSVVHMFSSQGDYLGQIGGEGEGPGEVVRPYRLTEWEPGVLAIVQAGNPAKIALVGVDGASIRDIRPRMAGDASIMLGLHGVKKAGDAVFVAVAYPDPIAEDLSWVYAIARLTADGAVEEACYESTIVADLMSSRVSREADDYPRELLDYRWDVDASGRVCAAPLRNEYEVAIIDCPNTPMCTLVRNRKPCPRPDVVQTTLGNVRRSRFGWMKKPVTVELEEAWPAVRSVHAMPDGDVWVLGECSCVQVGDSMELTYDVFDESGGLVRRVLISVPGNVLFDRCFLLSDNRAVVVREFGDQADEYVAALRELELGPQAEGTGIVCYQLDEQ